MDAKEVRLRKKVKGLFLEPLPENWNWLDAIAGTLDDDFVKAVQEQPPAMEHADLAKLFRP
jgi:antitoxin VapB